MKARNTRKLGFYIIYFEYCSMLATAIADRIVKCSKQVDLNFTTKRELPFFFITAVNSIYVRFK